MDVYKKETTPKLLSGKWVVRERERRKKYLSGGCCILDLLMESPPAPRIICKGHLWVHG